MGRHRVLCPAGREWSDWSSELRIPGDELKWKFISDGSVNGWGWRFTVYPIMPAAGEGPTAVLVPTWGLGSTGPCCSRSHPGPASRAEPPTCLLCVLAGGSVRCRCGAAAGGCAEETSACACRYVTQTVASRWTGPCPLLTCLQVSSRGSPRPVRRGDVDCAHSSGPKDLLSDRCILSCPSMDLVTCLLDFRLNLASNRSIVPRLAASLAACAQLSALGEWRLWHCDECPQATARRPLMVSVCSPQPPATGCGPCRD